MKVQIKIQIYLRNILLKSCNLKYNFIYTMSLKINEFSFNFNYGCCKQITVLKKDKNAFYYFLNYIF